jgi:hypothetical protein
MNPGAISRLLDNFIDESVGTVTATLVNMNDGKVSQIRRVLNVLARAHNAKGSCLNVVGALYAQRICLFRAIPTDAEVGLVKLARVSLATAGEVVAERRSKYSEKLYTQPQLLAILVLMRYEDWSLREAEARLSEHAELRRALNLSTVPHYTVRCACFWEGCLRKTSPKRSKP